MRSLPAFLLSIVLAAACGPSGAPPQTKVGVASPPPSGQTINYDPSVVGLPRAIGTTVYDSQGVISWTKYATSNTAWRPVPVSQLVTGDPSQAPGLKAPIGFTVTKNDGTASWVKQTSSDTGWAVNPSSGISSVVASAPLGGLGTIGTPLTISAANPDAGGTLTATDYRKLSTVDPGNYITETYVTSQIDWVAGGSVTFIPARPGYVAANVGIRIVLSAAAGTYSTGPTIKAGNNGTGDNIITTTGAIPTAASHDAAVSANLYPFCATSYVVQVNSVPFVDLTTPVTYTVTVNASGSGLVLKGHMIVTYTAIPISALN